jgi:hypothetical protein
MKKLLFLALILFLLLALSICAGRVIGTSQKDRSLAAIVFNASQITDGVWCWQNICPGYTSLAEAKNSILLSGGKLTIDYFDQLRAEYPLGYTVIVGNLERNAEPVNLIMIGYSLTESSTMSLADVVVNFGTPILIERAPEQYLWPHYICFTSYLCVRTESVQSRLNYHLIVDEFDFFSAKTFPIRDYQTWHGFTFLVSR